MSKMIKYERRLSNLAEIYSYLPDEKDRDTILGIFNKRYDENYISDYLAFILDPYRNGIGTQPLNMILDYFTEEDNSLSKEDNIEINREFTLSNNRRIDLLININDSLIIGIENKIFAVESQNQTSDYAKNIRNMFGNDKDYLFIFLTKGGKEATSEEFLSLTYKVLVSLFKKVAFDFSENIRKSIYYQDFIIHLEEFIMTDNSFNLSEKSKLYIANHDMIKDLKDSLIEDSKSGFDKIESYIKNYFDEKESDDWEYNFANNTGSSNRGWQQLYKDDWYLKGELSVHFEYHFGPKDFFLRDSIKYMVDAEGKRKEKFIQLFEKYYQENKAEFEALNIENRPDERDYAVAYKSYYPKRNSILEVINQSLEEFYFLIEIIDKTMAEYKEGEDIAR
jgi:hypothetical protein